jgi:hypothetical protein
MSRTPAHPLRTWRHNNSQDTAVTTPNGPNAPNPITPTNTTQAPAHQPPEHTNEPPAKHHNNHSAARTTPIGLNAVNPVATARSAHPNHVPPLRSRR